MKRDKLCVIQILMLILFCVWLLSGCSSPEKRAGRWQATSEFGDFVFIVDDTGTMITYIEYDLNCESGKMSNRTNMSGGPGSDLKDSKIGLSFTTFGIPMVEWEGKFNSGGTKASGTLWMFGRENCESKWSATKVE